MIDRTTIVSTIARFIATAQTTQQNAHGRASSFRLSSLLDLARTGDALSQTLRVAAPAQSFGVQSLQTYTVIGVDGSQIYPDRSFAAGVCGMINVGGIVLQYGQGSSSAHFFSSSLLVGKADMHPGLVFCPEVIDTLRALRELEVGIQKTLHFSLEERMNTLLLLDGSMIPYGLMLKSAAVQQFFATRFLALLAQCYENSIPVAWYISAPQSHMLARCVGEEEQTDAYLLDTFLKNSTTTPFFALNQSTLFGVLCPPEHAASFFYAKKNTEILRVECPFWVVESSRLRTLVSAVVYDQAEKGFGYPVALTEAHRQALITQTDRDFVLHQLQEQGLLLPGGAIKATRKQIIPA